MDFASILCSNVITWTIVSTMPTKLSVVSVGPMIVVDFGLWYFWNKLTFCFFFTLDETSETKLSLYVFLCTIILMIILVVTFMMKNKDKRKEIVRRMSRVYANNPILCVMETTGHNNMSAIASTSGRTSPIPSTAISPVKRTNIDIESKLPPTLAYLDDNNSKAKRTLKTSKSKISLSLPQGIDQLSTNSLPPRS